METYIALLRGINVSGQKKIAMKELKAFLEEEGFEQVTTYIQSGNVIFRYKKTPAGKLAGQIGQMIKKQYRFDVDVQVISPAELEKAVKDNPFTEKKGYNLDRLYLTLLAEAPDKERIKKLGEVSYEPEEFVLKGKIIYFYSPNGYGNAKMNNNWFESKLKVSATTRNWKTVNVLVKMADELA